MSNKTLAVIKPDALKKGVGVIFDIINRYLAAGLRLNRTKPFMMSDELFHEFYGQHDGKEFFGRLKAFSVNQPMIALLFSGKNAVNIVRKLNGPTNPAEAPKGTIRGDHGTGDGKPTNAVHGSGNKKDAQKEIKLIFG